MLDLQMMLLANRISMWYSLPIISLFPNLLITKFYDIIIHIMIVHYPHYDCLYVSAIIIQSSLHLVCLFHASQFGFISSVATLFLSKFIGTQSCIEFWINVKLNLI